MSDPVNKKNHVIFILCEYFRNICSASNFSFEPLKDSTQKDSMYKMNIYSKFDTTFLFIRLM